MAFTEILKKYWELHNEGKEPMEGDRDTLTFQLASDLRHICGRNADWLDQVIPCYDNFPQEEKRKKIESALALKMEGMPYRLKQVLQALKEQYRLMRQSQGKTGDGENTLRTWTKRGHITYDEVSGHYCKTEEYKKKYSAKQ